MSGDNNISETASLASSLSHNEEEISSQHQVNPIHDHPSIHSTDNATGVQPSVSEISTASRIKSRQSSVKTNRVSLKNRRGLLSTIVLIPEYEDARDYPLSVKYTIVAIIAFAAITGPMGTSIMLPAIDDIVKNLDTTVSMVNISVGIYLLSLGIFPLWWSAFSERFGRRSVYLVSFLMFFAFSIGTALAPSISALIVLRVLQGGCSASVQAVGAGTIADLFSPQNRGNAMGYYYLGPLCGPFFAPILGGVVAQVWGWRATQWLLVIFSGCNCVLIVFLLPETLRKSDNLAAIRAMLDATNPHSNDKEEEESSGILQRMATNLSRFSSRSSILLSNFPNDRDGDDEEDEIVVDPIMPSLSKVATNRSTYSRKVAQELLDEELKKSISHIASHTNNNIDGDANVNPNDQNAVPSKWDEYKHNAYEILIRPMHSIILLKHPPVALVIVYSSCCFAVVYFFNMTISYCYAHEPYNFSSIIIGLLYIPNSITYIIASIIGGKWNDHLLAKYAKSHNGDLAPESRISWNIVTAIILYPPACLIFGWALKYGEFWLIPLIGTALFGFASMLVIGATVTYLVDTLPGKGATGVALNNLIRQILAATATFVVEPLLRAIGPGILFTILMGIMSIASISLIILKRKGPYFREHYQLGKLYDKL
ncbi:A Q resistance multidrug resistance transporter [Scheffersomyces coipomensis]|uniref:A Q resistance multidrug resistance transporter n=1 Tax=Scheffersomyces coipomensis TaxID=1788519 RepID=UPI00315CDE80